MTKVTATGGHSNAVGLRLYYDSTSRPSRFGIEIFPDPSPRNSRTSSGILALI